MDSILKEMHVYFNINSEMVTKYFDMAVKVVLVIIVAQLSIVILNKAVVNLFRFSPKFRLDDKKTNTVSGILKSAIKYTIYIVMITTILNIMNILKEPVIAAAGIGGIAIGFGAQSLIRDVFTGFMILFEDQYATGDFITIGGMTGYVEDMGLRITKIRAINGDLHIVPNGEIKTVTNHTRGNSLAIVEVGILYSEDEKKARDIFQQVMDKYYIENPEIILEKPEVLGVIKFNESEVVMRAIAVTKALAHWQVERDMRGLLIEAFKRENIKMPLPKLVYKEN